jgi:Leucine-rich repeat (LRR) protein
VFDGKEVAFLKETEKYVLNRASALGKVRSLTIQNVVTEESAKENWRELWHKAVAFGSNSTTSHSTLDMPHMDYVDYGDLVVTRIKEILKKMPALEELRVKNSFLESSSPSGDEGDMLAMKIDKLRRRGFLLRLKVLRLTNINLTPKGAASITNLMRTSNILETISLANNHIGRQGAGFLAHGIKYGALALKLLDLRNNHIGSRGAMKLRLAYDKDLIVQELRLDLRNNSIGPFAVGLDLFTLRIMIF